MPAFQVTWTQVTTATAKVTLETTELVSWAIACDATRTLTAAGGAPPDAAALQRAVETNPHLRNALVRLWVIEHA